MKKALISIMIAGIMASPLAVYASEYDYSGLSRDQKQVLIVQLTALLHKILAQIAQIQAERATLVPMTDPIPASSPEEVKAETPKPDPTASGTDPVSSQDFDDNVGYSN